MVITPDEYEDQIWMAFMEPQYEGDKFEPTNNVNYKHLLSSQRKALAMYERRKNAKPRRKPVRKPDIPAVTRN